MMERDQYRTGLIAFGIVLVLAMGVGGAVWLFTRPSESHDLRRNAAAPTDDSLQMPSLVLEPGTQAKLDTIVGHPFWRRPVTRQQILAIVDDLITRNANTVLYIDDQANTCLLDGEQASSYRQAKLLHTRVGAIGARQIHVDLFAFGKRPSRGPIMTTMIIEMGRAE